MSKPFLHYWEGLYEKAALQHRTLYRFDTRLEAERFMDKYSDGKIYKENDSNYYVTVPSADNA